MQEARMHQTDWKSSAQLDVAMVYLSGQALWKLELPLVTGKKELNPSEAPNSLATCMPVLFFAKVLFQTASGQSRAAGACSSEEGVSYPRRAIRVHVVYHQTCDVDPAGRHASDVEEYVLGTLCLGETGCK